MAGKASADRSRGQQRDFAQQRADKLAREYFKARGITSTDQKKMRLSVLSDVRTVERFQFSYPSILIPYPAFAGDFEPSSFERVRFLADLSGETPKQKYSQRSDTPPRAYFPPMRDWPALSKDPTATLMITEGEFKSWRACKDGYNCIGIGGVFSFQNKVRLKPLIGDLAQIDYKNRTVVIVFDSDADMNPFVAIAEDRLARNLILRGATLGIVRLPAANGAKQGLDDFLERSGKPALDKLIEASFETGFAGKLATLNREYAVVRSIARILEIETANIFNYPDFHNVIGAKYNESVISDGGTPKVIDNIKLWFASEAHNEVEKIVFDPRAPFPYAPIDEDSKNYNLWRGWPVVEQRGDVSAWQELLDLYFPRQPKLRAAFECWVADPLVNVGAKQHVSVLLVSNTQGIGKSLTCEIIDAQYGDYAITIGAADLHSHFNNFAMAKLFIHAEEATPSPKDIDHLKHFITGSTIQIEEKFKARLTFPNRLNLILSSNHFDALTLSDEDRRFFVIQPPITKLAPALIARLKKLKETPAGIAALRWHFLYEVDLSNYDRTARAQMTEAKADMIWLGKSDMQAMVDELKGNPSAKLQMSYFPVMTTTEIGSALVSQLGRPSLAKGELKELGLALHKAFKKIGVRSRDNTKSQRLWVLDRKWASNLTTSDIYERWFKKRMLLVATTKQFAATPASGSATDGQGRKF